MLVPGKQMLLSDAISSATCQDVLSLLEVLQLVLLHVDPPQRLGPCALVNHTWRAAANTATSNISIEADEARAKALSGWLQLHGGQVQQLQVTGFGQSLGFDLALPCDQLTRLEKLKLVGFRTVQPHTAGGSGSGSRGHDSCTGALAAGSSNDNPRHQEQDLAALTQLTDLHLQYLHWSGSLQALSALPSLRQLQLYSVTHLGATGLREAAVWGPVSHLVQLTSLLLCAASLPDVPAHISCLQQLQELHLWGFDPTPGSLAVLPRSLTQLVLRGLHNCVLSSNAAPALVQLTALQHLELLGSSWSLDPVALSPITQLTHLRIFDGALLPAGHGSAGATALLAVVASMTLLQRLELEHCLSEPHAPAAAYAALTASSRLTHLRILRCLHYEGYPLPTGALNHMFATGRQLPSLQHLDIAVKQEQQQQQQQQQPHYLDLFQQGFDQCCPGLRALYVDMAIDTQQQPLIKLDGLLGLSGLTKLILPCLLVDEEGITNTLAQLTGLRHLVMCHPDVTYVVLLQLTKLQQLESLTVHGGDGRLQFVIAAPAGSAPNVSQRLQQRLAALSGAV